jgi:hypothetical protein
MESKMILVLTPVTESYITEVKTQVPSQLENS